MTGHVTGHLHISNGQLKKIKSQINGKSGKFVDQFESKFANIVGEGSVVSFASARMGFFALMKSMRVGPGDEVILCGSTCSVMPNAVLRLGATPIYSDINPSTLGSSLNSIASCISEKTKLIVAQHSFGIPCDIDVISKFCKEKKIFLIEDCAIALGSTLNGRAVGTFGNAAIFSTDHSKPINTIIGGIIYSEDSSIVEAVKSIKDQSEDLTLSKQKAIWTQFYVERILARERTYGALNVYNSLSYFVSKKLKYSSPFLDEDGGSKFKNKDYSYPSKLPEFIALLGLYELKRWKSISHERIKCLEYYKKGLSQTKFKEYLPKSYFDSNRRIVPLRFVFSTPNSRDLKLRLQYLINLEETWFPKPIINSDVPLEKFFYKNGMCPISEEIGLNVMNLPLTSFKKMDKIIKKIHKE